MISSVHFTNLTKFKDNSWLNGDGMISFLRNSEAPLYRIENKRHIIYDSKHLSSQLSNYYILDYAESFDIMAPGSL